MKPKNKIILVILAISTLLLLFALRYKYTYTMNKAEEFQVNTSNLKVKLLIATQGSDFKNAVTDAIVAHYKKDSIFIKIIDVSTLSEINAKEFNAILLIHTWENWKPPVAVKTFINNSINHKNKIIVFTTSGRGSYKMDGIDAITGESKLEDTLSFTNQIIKRLNPLLKK